MNTFIFSALAASLIAGLVLIAVGKRGKRINNHPQCRWCGFDLNGIYPATITCPECGAGLKRSGGVRTGFRQRNTGIILIGAVLALLPLAPMGIALYAASTGMDLNAYKPVGLLLFEARGCNSGQSATIARELQTRIQLQSVDPETASRITIAALELQENPHAAWSEVWGDIIEDARIKQQLTDEDGKRFVRNTMRLAFRARPTAQAGDPLPVELTLTETRCASSTSMSVQLFSAKASLNGKIISRPTFTQSQSRQSGLFVSVPGPTSMERLPVGTWWVSGGKSQQSFGQSAQPIARWDYQLPDDLSPGRYQLEVHLTAQLDDGAMGMGMPRGAAGGRRNDAKLFKLSTTIDILAADAAPQPPVSLSTAQEQQLHTSLTPRSVTAFSQSRQSGGRNDPSISIQIPFNVEDLVAPIAHKVLLISNGKEYEIGQLVSAAASTHELDLNWLSEGRSKWLHGSIAASGLLKEKSVDIVLRPDRSVAARLLDPIGVYEGELIFRNVPLNDRSDAYNRTRRSDLGSGEDPDASPLAEDLNSDPDSNPDK